MRNETLALVMAFVMVLGVAAASAGTLNPSDLTYQGYFTLNQGYAGYGLAYYPAGNNGFGSLFMSSGSNAPTMREFWIPPVGGSAGQLQDFSVRPPTGGAYGVEYLPAKGSQTEGKLYWGTARWGSTMQIQYGDVDGTNRVGYWKKAGNGVGESLFGIDQDWADTNTGGKSLLALGDGNSRKGPRLRAVAPWAWTWDDGTNVDGYDTIEQDSPLLLEYHWNQPAKYLQYPEGGVGHQNDLFLYAEYLTNSAGDASVVIGGDTGAQGDVLLFYDPADLAAVAGGADTWSPQPYAQMDMSAYGDTLHGAAFDEDGRTLYVSQYRSGSNTRIHVFQLAEGAAPIPEPATMVLLGLGGLAGLLRRRRR